MERITANQVREGNRIVDHEGALLTVKAIRSATLPDASGYQLTFEFREVDYWWACIPSDRVIERQNYLN